ncbi:MAG: hypothetical protein M0017_08890 [Desulfobacteraceae bacterium]|nr:hypothetical protein [Desulfobacteraceae bacterium]
MRGAKSLTKSKVEGYIVTDGLGNEVIKGAAAAAGAFGAGVVGVWAVSCLVSGAMAVGGPLALVKSWFMAVSGF